MSNVVKTESSEDLNPDLNKDLNKDNTEKTLIKCKKHPQYVGIFSPKADCPDCWTVYLEGSRGKRQGDVH